jgi:hypothetical protein
MGKTSAGVYPSINLLLDLAKCRRAHLGWRRPTVIGLGVGIARGQGLPPQPGEAHGHATRRPDLWRQGPPGQTPLDEA